MGTVSEGTSETVHQLPAGPLVVGRNDSIMKYCHREVKQEHTETFFGEDVRTCFEMIHIVDAGKVLLAVDFVKLSLETIYFVSLIGYFDTLHVTHLIWAVVAIWASVIGFIQERFFLFWPMIALKISKCLLGLFYVLLILIMSFLHRPLLRRFVKWLFPRVEQPLNYSVLLFFLLIVLFVIDLVTLDIVYRTQSYFRKKAMAIYFIQRREILQILA